METSIKNLHVELKGDSIQLRTCVETLIQIFRRILNEPSSKKYRTIKVENKKFKREVWQHKNAQQFMIAAGWEVQQIEGHESVVYPEEKNLNSALRILVDNRDVKPSAEQWVASTKIVTPSDDDKDRELRLAASIQREKEMQEVKKDMAERKRIAEEIKSEHKNARDKKAQKKNAQNKKAQNKNDAATIIDDVKMSKRSLKKHFKSLSIRPQALGGTPSNTYAL